MLRKITLLLCAFVLLAVEGVAQTNGRGCQSEQDWRSQVSKRMGAEAARLGLQVQGDYSFQWDGKVSMVFVQVVAKGDKIRPTRSDSGGGVTLAYVESEKPADLPNGLYLVRTPPELAERMTARFGNGSGVLGNQKITFASTDGRMTKDLPGTVMMYQVPHPPFRHNWIRVVVGSAFDVQGGGFWMDGP
jgi:hypothetical protein